VVSRKQQHRPSPKPSKIPRLVTSGPNKTESTCLVISAAGDISQSQGQKTIWDRQTLVIQDNMTNTPSDKQIVRLVKHVRFDEPPMDRKHSLEEGSSSF